MIYLSNFDFFISEQTTLPEFATSDGNRMEELTKMISDYNTKKVDIQNIYKIKEPNKRLDLLKSKKYLKPVVGQPGNMVFSNDLLKIWAEICDIKDKIEELDLQIKDKDTKMRSENQMMRNQDPNVKKTTQNNINQIKGDLQNINDKKTSLNKEISDKMEQANKKLLALKKELDFLKLKVNTQRKN